jgi:hypothetical protein
MFNIRVWGLLYKKKAANFAATIIITKSLTRFAVNTNDSNKLAELRME